MGNNPKRIVMKKIVIILSLVITTISLTAQPREVERLYHKYKGEEGVVSVYLPGFLMRFAGAIADLEHEERQLLRSIRSLRVLTIEDTDRYPHANFVTEARFRTPPAGYHSLVEVNSEGEHVRILAREKRGRIRDLLILVGGNDNTLVHIRGRMHTDLLNALAGVTGIEACDHVAL